MATMSSVSNAESGFLPLANRSTETILKVLEGDELEDFVVKIKVVLEKVRQFSYGKHLGQIEKIIEGRHDPSVVSQVDRRRQPHLDISAAATPPPLVEDNQSPRSTSQPSTNASTMDGPVGASNAGLPEKVSVYGSSGAVAVVEGEDSRTSREVSSETPKTT